MSNQPVISIHEYALKPGVEGRRLENTYRLAEERGLFDLPGLIEHHLLLGMRGHGQGKYAAFWMYEDEEAWAALWGGAGRPKPKEEYPESWQTWEEELLAPLITEEPDRITYTTYRTIA